MGFYLSHGKPLYGFLFWVIVFFAFFYTGIVFNPKEQADNLRNNGGFVLGYRPGEQTAQHLEHVIYRLTFVGAVYLGLIALIPEFLIARLSVPFYLGGTSLLIVVVVAMDFFSQIQTHLFTSQYEKILSKINYTKVNGYNFIGPPGSGKGTQAQVLKDSVLPNLIF